jgi:hypothetical protein
LKLSRRETPKDSALLGVAEKTLFCLVLGVSCVHRVKALETAESLRRFSQGLSDIVRRYST